MFTQKESITQPVCFQCVLVENHTAGVMARGPVLNILMITRAEYVKMSAS